MTTTSLLRVQNSLAKRGITATLDELRCVVISASKLCDFILNESNQVDTNIYQLKDMVLLEDDFIAYKADNINNIKSLDSKITVQQYDPVNPQLADIATQFEENKFHLLNTKLDKEIYLITVRVVDFTKLINELMFIKQVNSPITEMTKGNIKIKAKSPLETAVEYQRLKALSGDNIKCISVKRYSAGRMKGRGTNLDL